MSLTSLELVAQAFVVSTITKFLTDLGVTEEQYQQAPFPIPDFVIENGKSFVADLAEPRFWEMNSDPAWQPRQCNDCGGWECVCVAYACPADPKVNMKKQQ